MRDHLAMLLAEAGEVGRGLPRYVERAARQKDAPQFVQAPLQAVPLAAAAQLALEDGYHHAP